jgi:hypothetical protein
MPLPHLGALLLVLSGLALAGVNIFIGGSLDMRLDGDDTSAQRGLLAYRVVSLVGLAAGAGVLYLGAV